MELMTEEFIQTELGSIPGDWTICRFEDVMDGFSSGQTPYREIKRYYTGNIPWITSGELNYNVITDTIEKITPEAVQKTTLKIIPKGTFLMAITGLEAAGTRGSCAITGVDATTNQSCMALYPKPGLLMTDYLFHFYVRYGDYLAFKYCQGTKQQSYTGAIAKTLPIILPPTIEEQTAIATALSDADALITSLEKLIAKKKAIKQGVMQKLLRPKEGWEVKKLGDVVALNMGQSPDSEFYNSKEVGIPSIQGNADIENRRTIKRYWTTQVTKTCDASELILTVRAPVGFVAIASEYSCIGRGVCSIKAIKVDRKFLYHLLIYKENDWKVLEQGSTFTSANSNQIMGFELIVPMDKGVQSKIASILTDIDDELGVLESKLEKQRLLKQGMMQNLLTGKIRLL